MVWQAGQAIVAPGDDGSGTVSPVVTRTAVPHSMQKRASSGNSV